MTRKVIHTEKAAVTGGPYSQAIEYGGLLYLSGQGAADPDTNQLRLGSIEEEAELALRNISIILEEAGSSLERVLKVTVYLADMKEFDRFNVVYRRYFPTDPPARTCIQAGALPFGIRVEIELMAAV